jgi:hypothetical protein
MDTGNHPLLAFTQELADFPATTVAQGETGGGFADPDQPLRTSGPVDAGCLAEHRKGLLGRHDKIVPVQIDHANTPGRDAAKKSDADLAAEKRPETGIAALRRSDCGPCLNERLFVTRCQRHKCGIAGQHGLRFE